MKCEEGSRGEMEVDGGVVVGSGLMCCSHAVTWSAKIRDQPSSMN